MRVHASHHRRFVEAVGTAFVEGLFALNKEWLPSSGLGTGIIRRVAFAQSCGPAPCGP